MIRPVTHIDDLVPVRNVVISVFDKTGLGILVFGLLNNCPDVMIFASGGTYTFIRTLIGATAAENHLQEVSEYTGVPDTTGGLVNTLHDKLFLGYLTETYCAEHQQDLNREDAVPIDLVVNGLYPFEDVIKASGANLETARGNIDVGGPSALRAAAKNWHRVMTMANPSLQDYEEFVRQLEQNKGQTNLKMRFRAWEETFDALSAYDCQIYNYLRMAKFEEVEKIYAIH
jgi:phosphoribosylaminoimidazolecarboxamide formyltransferase/IMP cyclohydrolase